jgi:signal transduction histidine kinase
VTERRKLERRSRQAQRREAVGRLAGAVAHDLNSLLAVITGHVERLLETLPPGDPKREMVREVTRSGERAASLTRQLLAFSRPQVLAPEVLDLNALVADLSRLLYRLIGEDIRVATSLEPGLWEVLADPDQIEQVLLNLAVNARDAMPQGGTLTIETKNVELGEEYAETHPGVSPGRYVMLAVNDTGRSRAEEVTARAFAPLAMTKEAGEGTGRRPATVYGIVQQSGSHFAVEGAPGRGTSFKVYLPRASRPSRPSPVPAAHHPPGRDCDTV